MQYQCNFKKRQLMKAQVIELEENIFFSPKIVMNQGFEKAIEKSKIINFNDDEKRKTFLISYVIKYSIDRGICYSNLQLIRLYRKISSIYETTFEEIFILDKKVRTNKLYELSEEDTRTISFINFFNKLFFKKSSR